METFSTVKDTLLGQIDHDVLTKLIRGHNH